MNIEYYREIDSPAHFLWNGDVSSLYKILDDEIVYYWNFIFNCWYLSLRSAKSFKTEANKRHYISLSESDVMLELL